MLGAVAYGACSSLRDAMGEMNAAQTILEPGTGEVARYHEVRHQVFQRMCTDRMVYRQIMAAGQEPS
jgi:hypothetical protein